MRMIDIYATAICAAFGQRWETLTGYQRARKNSPWHLVCYWACTQGGYSALRCGDSIGRDHSSVLSSIRRAKLMLADPDVRRRLEAAIAGADASMAEDSGERRNGGRSAVPVRIGYPTPAMIKRQARVVAEQCRRFNAEAERQRLAAIDIREIPPSPDTGRRFVIRNHFGGRAAA